MPVRTPQNEYVSARDRLLTAAAELFNEEGINTVGIDRIIERAGVAKASLYNTFGSKDELIKFYLLARHETRQERIKAKLARYATPKEKILGMFDAMSELFATGNFRGCPFIRASAELKPESSVKDVCDETRLWIRNLFTELAKEAGARQPGRLAGQLVLLFDGATIAAQMDNDYDAAKAARTVAAKLLDEAISS